MKLRNGACAVVLAGVVALGGCAATGAPTMNTDLQQEVQDSLVGDGQVLLSIVDGVATLTGEVDSGADRDMAEQVVMDSGEATEVVNLVTVR